MLRPELQALVAAGATCQIKGRVDTYQREPAHGTVRVCLSRCTVRPVHHLQQLGPIAGQPAAVTTDHLWVRLPAHVIDGRPADPSVQSAIAREATTKAPTRLLDTITLVGRLGYYTDNRGQLGMGVQQVLPVHYGFTLAAMLSEAATQWRRYNDAQAHADAQRLLALVASLLRPARPGQAYIDTPSGPAMTLMEDGITTQEVQGHVRRLQTTIGASFEAQRRAAAGHRRARAKALGQVPAPCGALAALPRLELQQPTALDKIQNTLTLQGYAHSKRQQHQAVPTAVAAARPTGRRGFAA